MHARCQRHREVMPIDHRRLITAAKRLPPAAGALYLLVVVLAGLAQLASVPASAYRATHLRREHRRQRRPRSGSASSPTSRQPGSSSPAGVALYLLFRHIDRHATGALAVSAAVGAGLILVNLLFHHAAQLVAADPSTTPSTPELRRPRLAPAGHARPRVHDRRASPSDCACFPSATWPTSPAVSPVVGTVSSSA